MPQGLQVFDAGGNLTLDVTDRISRVLGVVTIAANASGSVSSAGFSGLSPFWFCVPLASFDSYLPEFSFDAGTNTLSWTWPFTGVADCRLVYGAY